MGILGKNRNNVKESILISLMIWVSSVKLIVFLIDPTVMFFINDSLRYIDTAVSSYIPPNRSFLYGFLIRWLTYPSRSLTTLVFFQVLCGAASSVMAGVVLNRFLGVNRTVAKTFAVLCAIAPIQLLYERYVLTETIATLFFVLFITAAFCYLRNPKIRTLIILNFIGVFLIAFRLSYLLIVLSGTVIIPCLGFFNFSATKHEDHIEGQGIGGMGIGRRVALSCFHVLISCILTYGLHFTYKTINGRLSNQPPAYQYRDGYHLLASWAPLLEKEDFADPWIEWYTRQYYYFDLKDRFQRMNHRWSKNGLISYIHQLYGSPVKTNKIARDTAMHILYRDPFGVMKLAWQSYKDYWNPTLLKKTLQGDRCTSEFSDEFMETLKTHYHIDGEGLSSQKTLTNQYFLNGVPWFMVLFSLPLIIAVSIYINKGRHIIFLALLGFFALLILMNSTALVHRNTMRFFHPDEWAAIIFLGVLFDRLMKANFVKNTVIKLRLIILKKNRKR